MAYQAQNVNDRLSSITKHWHPELLATVNASHSLKIAKIKGEFVWHCHPETDELFYCVAGGPMKLELATTANTGEEAEKAGPDSVVVLKPGDVFNVPRGMQHRPVAEAEASILMVEKVGTVNTGDREGNERTVYVNES